MKSLKYIITLQCNTIIKGLYRLLRRRGHVTAIIIIGCVVSAAYQRAGYVLYIESSIVSHKPLSDLNFARCLGTCPLLRRSL